MDARALKELGLLEIVRWYGMESDPARADAVTPAEPAPAGFRPAAGTRSSAAAASWEELRSLVAECSACGLCKQRKQAVFGVGAPSGPWMFVGEGPGADEDEQGEPFVGQAGKLLDNMLAAIGCRRGRDTYIANVVKCRPPGNRTPTAEEAAACAPFLDRQIELVAPKLIVALGKSAVVRLLGTDAAVASLRGKVHRYRGIPVVVTYHPAYLLRSLPEKAKAWEDLVFARRALAAT
jgi:DNA polymerase